MLRVGLEFKILYSFNVLKLDTETLSTSVKQIVIRMSVFHHCFFPKRQVHLNVIRQCKALIFFCAIDMKLLKEIYKT